MRRSTKLLLLGCVMATSVPVVPVSAGGCHSPDGAEPRISDSRRVAISECTFVETVVYIDRGDEVTWHNADDAPHTVTGALGSWGSYEQMWKNDEVTYSFKKDGVYPYFCELHPSMVGAVVVGSGKGDLAAGAAGITPILGTTDPASDAADEQASSVPTSQTSDNAAPFAALALVGVAGAWLAGRRLILRRRTVAAS